MNKTMASTLAALSAVFVSASADAEVVKVPAGQTVTIPLAKPVQYEVYRFVTKKIGSGNVTRLKFGELALYDVAGTRINTGLAETAYGTPYLEMPAKSCMLGGSCDHGTGNHVDYLFINYFPSGINTWANPTEDNAGTWHHVYMRLADGAPAVAAYNIGAGSGGSTANNPTAWSLEGSDDGKKWNVIDAVSSADSPHYIPQELTEGWYNGGVAIPLLESTPWKNEYQLQEGGTLAITGNVDMGKVVANDGTVAVSQTAKAQYRVPAETTSSVGGLTGSGTVEMSGAGTLNVDGNNAGFAGRLDVCSGTVRFVASHRGVKAKYYRFRIRALNLDGAHKMCQIGELMLYDSLGNRINLGLTQSDVTAVSDMAVGTCVADKVGGRFFPKATLGKAFDGDKNTSAEGWAECQTKHEYTWGHIYMRLAEDAPAVWAYDFTTGPDPVNNWFFNPISWSFESSEDGTTWTVHHLVDEELGKTLVPSAAGIGYSGGDAFGIATLTETVPPSSATLSVASGAKLVLPTGSSVAQTKLAIDLTSGNAGEIVNFKFAENGVLELASSEAKPKFAQATLPITLTDAVDVGNFAGWSVKINDREMDCYKLGVDAEGRPMISWDPKGLLLLFK